MPDTSAMMFPARCNHCSGVYDIGSVTVTARYVDCSVWKSPCCDRTVDDRPWKGFPDITRLKPGEGTELLPDRHWGSINGMNHDA